jgi:hypothetical protein
MTPKKLATALALGVCVLAWWRFAERPTTRSLGTALRSTLPFV